jgi:hypothetical protein
VRDLRDAGRDTRSDPLPATERVERACGLTTSVPFCRRTIQDAASEDGGTLHEWRLYGTVASPFIFANGFEPTP